MTADTAHDPKGSTTYRVMLAVVIILGVLILVAFGALIVGAAMKIAGHHSANTAAAPSIAPAQLSAELPAGARITSVSTTGNRVVIGVHTREGDEVDIFDADTGRPVARIRAAQAPK